MGGYDLSSGPVVISCILTPQPDMGSNANVFKCILNTFRKYLHLRFSNKKYLHLHLKKDSNTFQIHFTNTIYSVNE